MYPKYTQKIISYFHKNKVTIDEKEYKSKYVDFLTDTYKNINSEKIKLVKSDILLPINKSEIPLLYTVLTKLGEKIPSEKFVDWFKNNFLNFDFENFLLNYPKYHDLFFNPQESRKKLHELLYKNFFVSLDIIHFAETYELEYTEYKNSNTDIYIYSEKNKEKPDIKFIMKVITFYRQITQKNIPITLVILYCNQKKYFPNRFQQSHNARFAIQTTMDNADNTITSENMNSGCALRGEYVYIWRKEEFDKVLVHELIHYFHMDFQTHNDNKMNEVFHQLVNVEGFDAINEAYTEILAITINSVIKSIEYNKSFNQIINYEKAFTHLQIAKIIKLFGGETYADLFKIVIKQKTSLSSYIIAKGILQNNYQMILDYFDSNLLSNKIDKNKQFNNYEKMYINLMNKKSLNNKITNYFLNLIKTQKNNFIYNTLRMSLYG
jgi:hypothetical protein